MSTPVRHDPARVVLLDTRLRPAPALEPPYDDEGFTRPDTGTPLRFVPHPAEQLSLEPDEPVAPTPLDDTDFGPRSTPRADLPDPALHAGRFVRVVLEVLARRRPLLQLMAWTSDDVYEQLGWWLHPTLGIARLRAPGPAILRSVRVSEPADGIAEVTAVVSQPTRTWAAVLRLEGRDGRWLTTLIRIL